MDLMGTLVTALCLWAAVGGKDAAVHAREERKVALIRLQHVFLGGRGDAADSVQPHGSF